MDPASGAVFGEAIRERWNAIASMRRTPMQHWIWNEACFSVYYRGDHSQILFAGEPQAPSAAVAFGRPGAFSPRMFLAGAEENGEPIDPVYGDEKSADALARKIVASTLAIRFGHFPAQSAFLDALKVHAKGRGVLLSKPVAGSPYIALGEGWRDPLSQLSSRRRSDMRRMMRKAEKRGDVKFEILAPAVGEVDGLLEEAIAVEARSWKSRSRTAIADNEGQRKFYRAYGRLAAQAGVFRVGRMTIGGAPAAVQLGVECDDGFWLYKIGYDEQFGDCSPGNLMMLAAIEYAAGKGLSTFEFLGKGADWTKVWTQTERPNVALRFYPYTPYGAAAFIGDVATLGLGRIRDKLQSAFTSPRR